MWNPLVLLVLGLCSCTYAVPLGLKKNMAIVQQEEEPMMVMAADEETRPEVMISRLNLPSNATSIRADITDGFSCDNKTYGYYADVENDCQIFHVCLPVTYADGKENTFRWSFICPEETVFSQDSFTCMRPADMSIDCEESFKYYELNRNFGVIDSEDSPSTMDEEMNMEDMSRQPSSQEEAEDDIKQMAVAAPVKKQAVKVQSSNRRKTQTNRVAIDAQRRKVQPLRKIPQAVAPATAKPVEEDAPILEQEVERTTIKYQRFTKRPVTLVKEPAKPEQFKPEQQLVRTDLFAQKRKRPQVFSPTKVEAEPEASQKTEVLLEEQPENIVQDQAEAQASEIAEVSVKPQEEERIAEPLAVQKKDPAYIYIPIKEEIAPMPVNTPSRAEVVEIPIQKEDETLVAGAPVPIVEEPMPIADIVVPEFFKVEEEKLLNEELLAEQSMQAELTKILEDTQNQEVEQVKAVDADKTIETPSEAEKLMEAEKIVLDPVAEMEEAVRAVAIPVETPVEHPVESEVPASESVKAVETMAKPEMAAVEPEVAETPIKIKVPAAEPEMPVKIETDSEQLRAEVPSAIPVIDAEAPATEPEKPLETEAPAAEPEKPLETEAPAAEPEKPLETEAPVAKLDVLRKSQAPIPHPGKTSETEVPALVPEIPLILESAVPEMPLVMEAPVPEMPLAVEQPVELPLELPISLPEMALKIEAPTKPDSDKPLPIAELPDDITKTTVLTADKQDEIEIPTEPMIAQSLEPQMSAKAELPSQPMSQEPKKPTDAEKSSELPVEEAAPLSEKMEAQPASTGEETVQSSAVQSETAPQTSDQIEAQKQSTGEDVVQPSAAQSGDTQSLILDFISSLVKSENSNLEDQSQPSDKEQAASMPIPAAAMVEDKPAEIKLNPELPQPMYIPMMQDNEQMYQIPVQIIETPEPQPIPVAAEPKLPLSIDDVVELVKESLDTAAEKENLIQEPLAASSDEVKPIYHRYIELGSNLIKSEALTASDEDEPTVVAAAINDDSAPQEDLAQKAVEQLPEPEQLATVPEPAVNSIPLPSEPAFPTEDRLPMSRSLNRFRMDPRKRRFLFRSDAS